MSRPVDQARRAELLAGVVVAIERYGSDVSLQQVAAELGTSARMLIYYFGSREALMARALQALRPDLDAALARVGTHADLDNALRALWRDATAGEGRRRNAAILHLLGDATRADSAYRDFGREAVAAWLRPLEAALVRLGCERDDAEIRATVLVSGLRGLLGDRLITRQARRTDLAADRLITQTLTDLPVMRPDAALTSRPPRPPRTIVASRRLSEG